MSCARDMPSRTGRRRRNRSTDGMNFSPARSTTPGAAKYAATEKTVRNAMTRITIFFCSGQIPSNPPRPSYCRGPAWRTGDDEQNGDGLVGKRVPADFLLRGQKAQHEDGGLEGERTQSYCTRCSLAEPPSRAFASTALKKGLEGAIEKRAKRATDARITCPETWASMAPITFVSIQTIRMTRAARPAVFPTNWAALYVRRRFGKDKKAAPVFFPDKEGQHVIKPMARTVEGIPLKMRRCLTNQSPIQLHTPAG